MAVQDAVVVAVIGVIVLEGLWLAALTWLMWRRSRRANAAPAEKPQDTKPA